MDRENIISTFEKIISVCKEDGCDFVDLSFEDAEQILALLKEQEAVEPYIAGNGESFETAETWWYECGNCNKPIDPNDKFCRHCGKPVKWE